MKSILKANKKGMTLDDIYPAVLTIVLIGIILGIGIYVLAELRTNVATDKTGTDDEVNVTATIGANTTTLTDSTKDDYQLNSVVVISNNGTYTIPTTNYSFTSAGVITWVNDFVAKSSYEVNISSVYIYDFAGSPEAGINDTVDGLADFAGWIAVIVVVIAAAIVLGIVLSSFGRRTPGV